MKRALLAVSALVAAACTSGPLESGRYACERGQPNQCPGAWRCGLEGYCHQQGDTATAWRCETSDDCEGGWACGLARSRDHRECHDPAAPQDWPCEMAADCAGGWACGLAPTRDFHQCHDPAKPQQWPCVSDGDCVAGWKCGLTASRVGRECHDPQNPQAWACADDVDCLGGWRCSSELACVNPVLDALGTGALPALDGGERINPLMSTSPISLFSVSPIYDTGLGRGRQTIAFVQDGQVRALAFDMLLGKVVPYELDAGGDLPTTLIAQGSRGTDTDGRADERNRIFALFGDGGMTSWTIADGGVVESYTGFFARAMDHLDFGAATPSLPPSVVVFSSRPGDYYVRLRGDDYWYYDETYTFIPENDFALVPGNRMLDMTALRHSADLECVYAVDKRGLWVSQRGANSLPEYEFEAVIAPPFTNASCQPDGGGLVITSVAPLGDRWLAVAAAEGGGPAQVGLLDTSRSTIDHSTSGWSYYCTSNFGDSCQLNDRIPVDLQYGPCTACPGGVLADFAPVSGHTPPDIEVRCVQPDGGSPSFYRLSPRSGTSFACDRALVLGETSLFSQAQLTSAAQLAPGVLAWSGSAGQVWFGASVSELASVAFDRQALGVVRRSGALGDVVAFSRGLVGVPAPGIGLMSSRSNALSSSVAHAPTWGISGTQLVDVAGALSVAEGRTVGYLPVPSLAAPVNAALTTSTRGLRLAVVSAGNSLFAADMEATLAGGAPALLSQRLSTVDAISALTFPRQHAPATSGPLLSGYALSSGSVVRVVADTMTRWHVEAVPLPISLVALSVWFEGTRGRVGFQDGTVFSLPSRVRIAPPVPDEQAVDFAQACGQQFALGLTGLYRLASIAGSPVGRWEPVELPAAFAGASFLDGRVHAAGDELYVFTRTGEAARLTFERCPSN